MSLSKRKILTLSVLLVGVWQMASGLYIPAKAQLAQHLIHRAWTASLNNGNHNKPWAWADTAPVARLTAPDHNEDFIVLSGASGEALAFGPGHVDASAAPGSDGHIVIGGHRDTHFRFLEHVTQGQKLQLQARDGTSVAYEVESIYIADITRQPLVLVEHESLLTLITCYPFGSVSANKNLRYVVTARGS